MLMLGWAYEVWPPRAVELFILMPQILHVAAGLLMASFGGVRFLCAILAGLGLLATVVFGSKKIFRESESSFTVQVALFCTLRVGSSLVEDLMSSQWLFFMPILTGGNESF